MRSRFVRLSCTLLVLLFVVVACEDENLVNNPSFDLWCGESLCSWHTDSGSIERVGSWHKRDYAVAFEEANTQISQVFEGDPVDCMRFDMIADAAPEAQLSLVLDFNNDGREDFAQRITDVRWESVQFLVRPPADYKSVRFILRKQGSARGVIAQLRVVEETDNCDGAPILLEDASACTTDASCESGLCALGSCSECAAAPNPPPGGRMASTCEEGSLCHNDQQCANNTCAGGVCQECALTGSCPALSPCDANSDCKSGACVPRLTFGNVVEATACLSCTSNLDCGGETSACTDGVCEVCLHDPFPKQCAECREDSECASGMCEQGLCALCRTDEQCPPGQQCRFPDGFDVGPRACTDPLFARLPRGALCETNEECADGLPCGAAALEPKRCGISCEGDPNVCGAESVCTRAGFSEYAGVIWFPQRTQPGFAETAGRIATCYPIVREAETQHRSCTLHAQCESGACCDGQCAPKDTALANLRTGGCTSAGEPADPE